MRQHRCSPAAKGTLCSHSLASESGGQILRDVDQGDAHGESGEEAHADGREERQRHRLFGTSALFGDVDGTVETGIEICVLATGSADAPAGE